MFDRKDKVMPSEVVWVWKVLKCGSIKEFSLRSNPVDMNDVVISIKEIIEKF